MSVALRCRFGSASMLRRFPIGFMLIALGAHCDITPRSLRLLCACHFSLTLCSHRVHVDCPSRPLRVHVEFTPVSLRFHFGVTSVSLRLYCKFTPASVRPRFESTLNHFELTTMQPRRRFGFRNNTSIPQLTALHQKEWGGPSLPSPKGTVCQAQKGTG